MCLPNWLTNNNYLLCASVHHAVFDQVVAMVLHHLLNLKYIKVNFKIRVFYDLNFMPVIILTICYIICLPVQTPQYTGQSCFNSASHFLPLLCSALQKSFSTQSCPKLLNNKVYVYSNSIGTFIHYNIKILAHTSFGKNEAF